MKHFRRSIIPACLLWLLMCLLLFMCFLLTGCGGRELILPAKADLETITVQEYLGD